MKKTFLIVFAIIFCCLLSSCSTTSSVSRISSNKITDVDGNWNDTDVQIVCETLIESCLSSAKLNRFNIDNGRLPILKVGTFRNQSQEHIDTTIISNKFRNAIINSGRAEFVADSYSINEVRAEKESQQDWSSWDSAKSLANEQAADYLLQGSVKSIVQKNGNKSVKTYFVYAELVDIESGKIIWTGENDEIKKVIKLNSIRF
ncbi:MAG: penicillin-binding protein activator LpoB [Sphaerochaetaceae bacterium]|nr:penicillin-binding protein activator LpoB [Sphaerochaetaceae bacterium]MCF0261921.1 penicillin-binding protein activator LpoB [Sphaerochaetaceae bacterium]